MVRVRTTARACRLNLSLLNFPHDRINFFVVVITCDLSLRRGRGQNANTFHHIFCGGFYFNNIIRVFKYSK